MSTRSSRWRKAGLAAAAVLLAGTALVPAAHGETGPPRTVAQVRVLSDSTAPDPSDDGIIPTFDVARYRVDVSQNGAASVGDVLVEVTLDNGVFVDRDPSTATFDLPAACGAGSTISEDRATLACNVGPLEQGTSLAFEYLAMAYGDTVANGDILGGTITAGGVSSPLPELTIEGAPYVDVAKSSSVGPNAVSGARRYVYSLRVRASGPSGKGGLPLSSVTFTEDWSDALAQFPGATASLIPAGGGSGLFLEAGTWTIAAGPVPGTSTLTVTDLNAMPDAQGYVAGVEFAIDVPVASMPVGTRVEFDNVVTATSGAASDGSTATETILDNNTVTREAFREAPSGGIAGVSSWLGTDSAPLTNPGFDTSLFAPVPGNTFGYTRGFGGPDSVSSTGLMQTYPGQEVLFESAAAMARFLVGPARTKLMTCSKFTTPVTVTGPASAVAIGAWSGPGPALQQVQQLASVSPVIYYSSDASTAPTASCLDGTWSTTPGANVTAVRSVINVEAAATELAAENLDPQVALRVPVRMPGGAAGLVRAHNVVAAGNWSSSGAIAAGSVATLIGNEAPGLYDSVANTGNPRYGDRLLVGPGWVEVDKTVCDTEPGTHTAAVATTVEFCLIGRFEGTAPISDVTFVDDGGLGLAGSALRYRPGSATVQVGTGAATAITPTIDAGTGTLTFPVGTVNLTPAARVTTVTVRLSADVAADAEPGSQHRNIASVTSPDLPEIIVRTEVATNPQVDDQTVVIAASQARLQVAKSTSSPSVVIPGAAIGWDLHLTNAGPTTIGTVDLIDVLPHNGDDARDRVPPSNFTGAVGLTGPVVAAGTVTYTSAQAGTVVAAPLDPSNAPGGSTTWCVEADFGQAGCPGDFAAVTAIRVVDPTALLPGATRSVTVPMRTAGNRAGDVYTNDTSAVVQEGQDGPWLPITSNDVTVTVEAPGLSIIKTNDGDSLTPGEEAWYSITIRNDGPITEPAAVITDELRDGLEFVSAPDGGTYDDTTRTVTWPAVALAPGESHTVDLWVRVARPAPASLIDDTGRIPNTARVTGEGDCP